MFTSSCLIVLLKREIVHIVKSFGMLSSGNTTPPVAVPATEVRIAVAFGAPSGALPFSYTNVILFAEMECLLFPLVSIQVLVSPFQLTPWYRMYTGFSVITLFMVGHSSETVSPHARQPIPCA
jgi:hypothetical protein